MMHNKLLKWLLPTIAVGLITACSSGSSSSSNSGGGGNGDASTLQILTPKIIYSKTASVGNGYVTVINPTTTTIKNLSYSLNNPVGSGSSASIDEASAANCAVIAANSQCNIKLNVAAGAVAGSLGFCVSNNGSLLSKIIKSTQDAKTAQLPIGIEQAYYNNVSGADGITLSYYHTVIAGVPYILVSGIVASDKAGSFNKIVLVDGNGNPLPNQQLISGNVSSAQGSTFTVLLPVSASSGISQTIKVQTQQVATDGSVTVVSTAAAASTLATTSGVGIADMLPGAIYLTSSHPEQTITFVNSGDAQAQLQSLVASNPNTEIVFNPTSLASGAMTTATLKLKNLQTTAATGSVTLNYNNSKETTSSTAVVEQNVSPQPNPSPSPTPTSAPPTPPPPPAPVAALTLAVTPDSDFFTTTAIGTVSRQLTLTNIGNTTEDNFVLTLPANFTISSGNSDSCTISGNTLTNPLGIGGHCDITVTYAHSVATSQAAGNISIAYDYNSGTAAPTPATAAVNYKVTQSTANLSLTPDPVTFANVLNNNVDYNQQTATLTNSGDIPATNLAFNITGTDSTLFSTPAGGTCVSGSSLSNTSGSNSCTITTQFGPAASSVTDALKTASLDVSYMPYSGGTTATATSSLSGQIVTTQSANIAQGTATPTGFAGGDGSSGTPYQIQKDATPSPTISYTITNSGTVPASNFYLSGTASGWTASGDCGTSASKVTLAASTGSCTVTFTPDSLATVSAINLNLSGITMNWTDQANPSGQTQNMSGTQYVNVYAPASIAITSNPASSISVAPGGSFTITATLTGGYNVAAQTVQAALTTGTTGDVTFTNNNCSVSSLNGTCTITVNASGSAANADGNVITLSNTTASPAAQPSPTSVTFAIAPATPKLHIFVTSGIYSGDLKTYGSGATGFDGANNICNTVAAAGSATISLPGQWKALLYSNNATVNGTTYYDTSASQTEIATATGGNLVGWTAESALLAPISYTENGVDVASGTNQVWTGSSTPADNCGSWTIGTRGSPANYGGMGIYSSYTTKDWYYKGRQFCDQSIRLYCVQQPVDG